MRRRRRLNVFGLAFLDAMMCGFGSVVLLYMVINSAVGVRAGELTGDLQAEVDRLEAEVLEGVKNLVELRNSLDENEREEVTTRGLSRRLIEVLEEVEAELATFEETTLARKEHLNKLKTDIQTLEEEARRLAARVPSDETPGDRLRTFVGDGDRQYLTGLKVGGDRIFILLDRSASMLDDQIVNIVRKRNQSDEIRRQAPKWRRAVSTVDWLTTQIPRDSRFQIYTFHDRAAPVLEGTDGQWLDGGSAEVLDDAVAAVRREIPAGGTNLYRAFSAVNKMRPAPDNLILIVDGLPTQGQSPASGGTISAKRRKRLFDQARNQLSRSIPVNVILFPMEGDPMAASSYWRLALATNGSFLSPSKDWP